MLTIAVLAICAVLAAITDLRREVRAQHHTTHVLLQQIRDRGRGADDGARP